MIKDKKLSFCNIGRFVTPQTIHLDRFDSLNQVDAINNLTGGSSGSYGGGGAPAGPGRERTTG